MNCEICGAQYRETCPNSVNHGNLGGKSSANSYSAMKKDELVALCQEKRIELTGDESKADLIALLEE